MSDYLIGEEVLTGLGDAVRALSDTDQEFTPNEMISTINSFAGGSSVNATDTSAKLYLIGATAQEAKPQTYSQDTAFVGTDGCLYSDGKKVSTLVAENGESTASSDSVDADTLAGVVASNYMTKATYDTQNKQMDVYDYANSTINAHNNSDNTHQDIRALIVELQNTITNFVTVGPTAPTSTIGVWIDTSSNNVLKFYNNGQWIIANAVWN